MSLVDRLIREELTSLTPYESARRLYSMADSDEVSVTWLNANENPEVPDIEFNPSLLNRYPDFQPEPLLQGYANYTDLPKQNILATRGADEGIELLIRTFCNRGDSILINPPTYGMYAISAETEGVKAITVQTKTDFQLDLPNILSQVDNVKILFICSPNNPTGQVIKREDIIQVLEHSQDKCLVICDEAYIEFCPEASVKSLMSEYPNLVILRTLSKAFGLAGIRCGFTLANEEVINAMKKVIAPYPVPAPVAQIATQVLSAQGLEWMQSSVAQITKQKQKFVDDCSNLDWIEAVYPTDTNFVLLKLTSTTSAETVMAKAIESQVLLRNQSKQLLLNNTIRVSIGNSEQMNKLMTIFSKV
jgi:histidinol-phosphate aminotransferase